MSMGGGAADFGMKAFGWVFSITMNVCLFASMAWAGFIKIDDPPPPDFIEADLVSLPILGKPQDPKALPRIVKAPESAPPPEDVVKLGPREEELDKKKAEEKKRLADEKKQRELEEKKRKEELDKKKAKERRDRMMAALNNIDDPRAEDAPPVGSETGSRFGTSTDANMKGEMSAYASRVSLVLQRQFQVPSVISPEERKHLKVTVGFRIDETGHVVGAPRFIKKSGNPHCDSAALRTIKVFSQGSQLKIPLPPASSKQLRQLVLQKGITAKVKCGG